MATAREGPRERLAIYGGDRLSDEELLAILLGTGMRGRPAAEVARALVAHCGGIHALARASPHEMACVRGVGQAQAARLAAAFLLMRRALAAGDALERKLEGAQDVYLRLRAQLAGLGQEVFIVLALDRRNAVRFELEVARGWLTGVDVHPREVFRPLIRGAAAACVIVHNHPSGDPTPSPEDVALTKRLRAVGDLVGIPVLDHVIVAGDDYVSLAEWMCG